jgi:hypothetical protein
MMAVEAFKETFRLLGRMPILWVPGIVAGLLAAALWVLLNTAGIFFTSRIFIIAGLVLFLFIVGMLVLIKENTGDLRTMISSGISYYFRVLIPQLVILFMLILIFLMLAVTFGFAGSAPDPSFIALLTVFVMIPTLALTFFFDIAAVFEDKKVFESIQRSSALVSANIMQVFTFFLVCSLACITIVFSLMLVWEAALYDNLKPLAEYNQTQIQSFTAEQLMGMIGPDGIWITAIVLFIGGLVLVPFLYSYKACFYRRLIGSTPSIQPQEGEYDSKGRWYKY